MQMRELIALALKARNIRQSDVAKKLNISASHLSSYLRGKRGDLKASVLRNLLSELGLNLDQEIKNRIYETKSTNENKNSFAHAIDKILNTIDPIDRRTILDLIICKAKENGLSHTSDVQIVENEKITLVMRRHA